MSLSDGATTGPTTARCGEHPDRDAAVTCGRCGTFLCADCVADFVAGTALCRACRPKVREVRTLPWDDAKSPLSFAQTFFRILVHPVSTFRYLGEGPLPLGFAMIAIGGLVALSVLLAMKLGLAHPDESARMLVLTSVVALAAVVVFALYFTLLNAAVSWTMVRLAGARTSFRAQARAAAYAAPGLLIYFAVTQVAALVRASQWLAWLGFLLFLGLAFGAHAHGHARLSTKRSLLVVTGVLAVWIAQSLVVMWIDRRLQ